MISGTYTKEFFFFLPASKMILYDFELEVQKVYLSHLEDFYFQEYWNFLHAPTYIVRKISSRAENLRRDIISFSLLLMERANANVSVLFILCWIFCSFLISYVRSLQAVVHFWLYVYESLLFCYCCEVSNDNCILSTGEQNDCLLSTPYRRCYDIHP